jgi:hypothetical protein
MSQLRVIGIIHNVREDGIFTVSDLLQGFSNREREEMRREERNRRRTRTKEDRKRGEKNTNKRHWDRQKRTIQVPEDDEEA